MVVACATLVMASGCGSATTSTQPGVSATPRECGSLRFPYPDPDIALTAADTGKSATIHPGGLVMVDLFGPPDKHWSPILMTGSGVQSLGTQAMTPTVGSRLGEYCGVAPGIVTLSSSFEKGSWTATIKVQ